MDSAVEHVVFAIGSQWFAVPCAAAHEVATFHAVRRVPGAPEHVLGVVNHRGEILPVFDLAPLVGQPPLRSSRAVVVRDPQGAVGIAVSKVAGVTSLSLPPRVLAPGGPAFLSGPVPTPAHEVRLIAPEALLAFAQRS